jgi:hypothetical protein
MSTICFKKSIQNFILIFLFLTFSSIALPEDNSEFRQLGGDFLQELTTAENRGMGISFVGLVEGANSLGNNPAGLALVKEDNRMSFNMTRFPRTVAVFSKLNDRDKYEDYSQYDLSPFGTELLNYAHPFGRLGTLGFGVVFRQEGRFSRVDDEGKAVNTFPENDFAVTLGYGKNLAPGAYIGFDAKVIRSKAQDLKGDDYLGRGYAYNIGYIQRMNTHWKFGGVIRNLSNGLSFASDEIPDKLRRDIIVGIAYQRENQRHSQRFGLDFNFPFKECGFPPLGGQEGGFNANIGGEFWYRQLIGMRLGYVRYIQKRFEPILHLTTGNTAIEERLWITEGLTYGLGLRLHNLEFNFAYAPQRKPETQENEKLRLEEGNAIISFSISNLHK